MLAAVSTGNKIGLATVAAVFIAFALVSALVVPRYRPRYPARGLAVFVVATIGLFLAQMFAVHFFGREEEEPHEPAARVKKGERTPVERGEG